MQNLMQNVGQLQNGPSTTTTGSAQAGAGNHTVFATYTALSFVGTADDTLAQWAGNMNAASNNGAYVNAFSQPLLESRYDE